MVKACEFIGHANTVDGRVVPCPREQYAVMRLRTLDGILMGKPIVCEEHMRLLLSAKVRAAGRDWAVDRFVREHGAPR